jgi:hypothetical protein
MQQLHPCQDPEFARGVGLATGDEPGRPNTVVTRAEPPYTLGQLTDVVIAVDQATR